MSSTTSQPKEIFGAKHFDKIASAYENVHTKEPMAKAARELISLAPAITTSSVIHDNACGPGILVSQIIAQINPGEGSEEGVNTKKPVIHATDISPGMISVLQGKADATAFGVKSEVMDSCSLSFSDETFTHSFTSLGIFHFPYPEKGASEIYRTLQSSGTAIVTSIRKVGWVEVMQAAQKSIRPGVSEENGDLWLGPIDQAWYTKEKLLEVLVEGGFDNEKIDIKEIRSKQTFKMVEVFLDGLRDSIRNGVFATGKEWNEDEKERFWGEVESRVKKGIEEDADLDVWLWVGVCKK